MGKWLRCGVLALAVSGCTALGLGKDDPLQTGRILFDCYRVDTEWGYRLEGIYIDSDGAIWGYQRDEPWYPAEQKPTVVSERDLLQKIAGAQVVGAVDRAVLTEMVGLIEGASEGRVAREVPSFERSGSLDVAYEFDTRERRYNQIFLGGDGAWVAKNFSPEATRLLEWLRSVKREVGFVEE